MKKPSSSAAESVSKIVDILSSNWKKVFRISVVLIIVTVCTVFLIRERNKRPAAEDCTYFKKQADELLQAIIEIRTNLPADAQPASFTQQDIEFQFASVLDTTKPMTTKEMRRYLDSVIILQNKRNDSLKRAKKSWDS